MIIFALNSSMTTQKTSGNLLQGPTYSIFFSPPFAEPGHPLSLILSPMRKGTNYMREQWVNIFTCSSKIKLQSKSSVKEEKENMYKLYTDYTLARQTSQDKVTLPHQSSSKPRTCCLSSSTLAANSSLFFCKSIEVN